MRPVTIKTKFRKKVRLPSISRAESCSTQQDRLNTIFKEYNSFDAFDESPLKEPKSSKFIKTESSFKLIAGKEIYPSINKALEHIKIGRKTHSSVKRVFDNEKKTFKIKNLRLKAKLKTTVIAMKKTHFKQKNLDPVRIRELAMRRENKDYAPEEETEERFTRESILDKATVLRGNYIFPSKRGPNTRTHSTLTRVKDKLFLFGGASTAKFNELWAFDLRTNTWTRKKNSNLDIPSKYNHSTCLSGDKLVIYGGTQQPNETADNILVYDIEKERFSQVFFKNWESVGWRKKHVAQSFGSEMFVIGGDPGVKTEHDCIYSLNTVHFVWRRIPLEGKTIPNLQQASSCAVISKDRMRAFTKDCNLGPFDSIQLKRDVKGEGMYVFGGRVGDRLSDKLYWLKIGRKTLKLKEIRNKGRGPSARIGCSLDYCREMHFLVVHGGLDYQTADSLNDFHLFDLNTRSWVFVNIRDEYPIARHDHFSAVVGNRLYILGGLTNNAYVGSEIYTVNLDTEASGEPRSTIEKKNKIIEEKYHLRPQHYQNLMEKFRNADAKKSTGFITRFCKLAEDK